MQWNDHSKLKDKHAIFSASQSSWVNYSDQKAIEYYNSLLAKERGTRLHAFAAEAIALGEKLSKSNKTVHKYVNDAIGFGMRQEQILYYSDNFYGTADAISFKKNLLRIHDLKTGKIPAHMRQLHVYAALFCLEYHIQPADIDMELRIYQNDDIIFDNPETIDIVPIMDKIITFDKLIDKEKENVVKSLF